MCRQRVLKALEVVADVTHEEDLIRLVETTIETFGKIDILVNNAGVSMITKFSDLHFIEKYKAVMETNLNSSIYLTHICVKHLEKTKGNIINISSICSMITLVCITI